jgi:hypothetical protein
MRQNPLRPGTRWKKYCHQMAAAHRAAMRLVASSLNTSLPPVEMARLSNAEGGQAVIAANMKSGAGGCNDREGVGGQNGEYTP